MYAAWSDTSWADLRPSSGEGRPAGRLEQFAARMAALGQEPNPVHEVHWMDQVHGSTVHVARSGGGGRGRLPIDDPAVAGIRAGPGDGLVTATPSVALAVLTADCASIALGSTEGVLAAVHAGWRGLIGGVVEAAVRTMRALGATDVVGALGPCIHPGCYEFSEDDLAAVAAVYGEEVRGRTTRGRPALDIPAAVSAALSACGATETAGIDACTACSGGYFSHRERRDGGRQAMIVWSSGGALSE